MKSFKPKTVVGALTAGALAASLALTGCGGSASGQSGDGSASSKDAITFMGWGTPQEVAVFKKMISQFEDLYPGAKVNYINVPAADYASKLQTMIASKQVPDVFYLQPEKVMPFAEAGITADLSDFASDNQIFEEGNVWPKALDMYRYDGSVPGVGALYGFPKDIGPFALAYNKDLFEEAGVTAPASDDDPWTWDDFLDAAKKITKGEGPNKVYGSAPYSVESAVWSNGADWLNDDYTEVTITDPKFVEALQWVADLILVEGVVPPSEEESSLGSFNRFLDGHIGMMGIGPWSQGQFWQDADFEWDIMGWPVSPSTGEQATWYGGLGFAVSNNSKKLDDAMNLAAFLAFNEDAQRTAMEEGQAIPNLIDMAETEYMTMDKPPANKQEFIDIIEVYGRRATQTYTYNSEWFTEFNANVAAVWEGEETAQEFVERMQPEMQKLLDKGIAEQAKG